MPLTLGTFLQSDDKGSIETLSLVQIDANTPTQATIATAAYGNNTTNTVISKDKLSVKITVLPGTNALVVTVVSPNPTDSANLIQGGTVFATFVLTEHWDSASLKISGT